MCLSPLLIDIGTRRIADIKIPTGHTLSRWYNQHRNLYNLVPCGQCVECLQAKAAMYTSKLLAESLCHREANGYFVTWTYDNYHLPPFGSLEKDALSRLRCHLRQHVCKPYRKDGKLVRPKMDDYLRYFAIGEYGTKYDRPHYHMCLWSDLLTQTDIIQLMHTVWSDDKGLIGQIDIQPFQSTGAVGYVSKYHSKRLANVLKGSTDDVTSLRFKISNGMCIPPYIRCSKELGLSFFQRPEIRAIYERGDTYKYNGFSLLCPYPDKVLSPEALRRQKLEFERTQMERYFKDIDNNIAETETYKDYLQRTQFLNSQGLKNFLEKKTSKF